MPTWGDATCSSTSREKVSIPTTGCWKSGGENDTSRWREVSEHSSSPSMSGVKLPPRPTTIISEWERNGLPSPITTIGPIWPPPPAELPSPSSSLSNGSWTTVWWGLMPGPDSSSMKLTTDGQVRKNLPPFETLKSTLMTSPPPMERGNLKPTSTISMRNTLEWFLLKVRSLTSRAIMRKLVYDPLYISKSNKLLFLSPMYQIFIFLTRIKVFDLIVGIPRGRFRSKPMNPSKDKSCPIDLWFSSLSFTEFSYLSVFIFVWSFISFHTISDLKNRG